MDPRRQRNRQLLNSPETIQKIIQLYKDGKSINQISHLLPYNRKVITNLLFSQGVDLKPGSEFKKEKSQDNLIVSLHNEGLTITKISKQLNICKDKVRRVFRDNGIVVDYQKPLSNEEKDQIEKLYSSGLKIIEIASELDRKLSTITRALTNKGIEITRTNYRINWNCLDNINSELQAYFLGLIWTNPRLDITLGATDQDVLENVSIFLCNKNIVKVSDRGCRLLITNPKLLDILIKATSDLNILSTLSAELIPHFIRGLLDRNGGVYINNLQHLFVNITGDKEFLEKLQLWIKNTLDIKTGMYPIGGSEKYFCRIANVFHCYKFFEVIYSNCNYKLSANYDKYINNDPDVLFKRFNKNLALRSKEKAKIDMAYKLRLSISNRIGKILKKNGSSKNGESILKHLQYTMRELKEHLESQFEPWMTWDNHKIYNVMTWKDDDPTTWTWNIDHIIPQSDLPYTSMSDDNFKKCWALSNLRPYSAKENVIDGASRIRHSSISF